MKDKKEEQKVEENIEKTKAIKFLEAVENFFLKILDKIKLKFLADIYRNHLEGMRYLKELIDSGTEIFASHDNISKKELLANDDES